MVQRWCRGRHQGWWHRRGRWHRCCGIDVEGDGIEGGTKGGEDVEGSGGEGGVEGGGVEGGGGEGGGGDGVVSVSREALREAAASREVAAR
jgi:hypothetical protein